MLVADNGREEILRIFCFTAMSLHYVIGFETIEIVKRLNVQLCVFHNLSNFGGALKRLT